jgi:hypothetical protein
MTVKLAVFEAWPDPEEPASVAVKLTVYVGLGPVVNEFCERVTPVHE